MAKALDQNPNAGNPLPSSASLSGLPPIASQDKATLIITVDASSGDLLLQVKQTVRELLKDVSTKKIVFNTVES